MSVTLRLTGDWTLLSSAWKRPNIASRLRRSLLPAMRKAARIVAKREKQAIRRSEFGPKARRNATLTGLLKGHRRPLLWSHETVNAIRGDAISWDYGFAGLWSSDDPVLVKKAVWNHDGTKWPVTKKMRNLFFVLHKASFDPNIAGALTGRAKQLFDLWKGPWEPLEATTTEIVIPARPWVEVAVADPATRKAVLDIWIGAIRVAMVGRKTGFGGMVHL